MDNRLRQRRFIALSLVAAGAALLLFGCEEPGPPQTGSIRVTSTPLGARIFLDQSDTGRVTPFTISEASVGFHTIRLTLDGHSDWGPQSVSVTAGQTATVDATLEPTTPSPEPVVPVQRGLGLRRQNVQAYQSAYILRADPVISLPSSVDLSLDVPLPRSQGFQGSCVGWAVAFALKTYHERIERGWPLNNDSHMMSAAYVYNQIKVPGGGAYYFDAFNLLLDQGVSSWAQMPYDPFDDRTLPSAAARAEAADYKIDDWGAVLRTTHAVFVEEIKRHLVGGDPVLIAIPVYPDFDLLSELNPVYDDDSDHERGAHAIVIVGYDDARSGFKIVNSWGTDWGIGGYGWIDYDASESPIWEAYVTGDVLASPDGELPVAASDPSPGAAATGVAVNTPLSWTRNARTTSFDVYLGTDRDLRAVDFQRNVAQATFAPDLAPASRYYWRIDARGAGGVTRGPVWSFTTAGTPELPREAKNPRPADGETAVALDTVLSWDSGGHTTSYDVYLGTNPVPGASELQRTQAGRTFSPMTLLAATRYYWRIDARGAGGVTRGPVWSFTTAGTPELPRKAKNPSPADGETEVALDTVLSWDSGGRTTSYDVYFGTNPVPGASDLQRTQATRTFSPGELTSETRYYWRVDAKNGQRTTTGTVWTFTTADGAQPQPGTVWRTIAGVRSTLHGITSNGERFVAVGGFDPGSDGREGIWHSADGDTWQPAADATSELLSELLGEGEWLSDVVWNGERFVAVGWNAIVYSLDGVVWRAANMDENKGPFDSRSFYAVAWGGDRFVAVGPGDVGYSTNGVSWTTSRFPMNISGVTWDGERFIAVGNTGFGGNSATIAHSPDGIRWRLVASYTFKRLSSVAWNGGRFVAVGEEGTIAYSRDGLAWTVASSVTSEYLQGVTWNGKRFVAVGSSGFIVHSRDGISWQVATSDASKYDHLYAVAWNGERFVAVGHYTMLTSP